MTPARRCACALTLLCLVLLLLLPEGTLGDGLRVENTLRPRAAWWLNLGPLNKYVEKILNTSSKKSKTPKKTVDTTKYPPSNSTKSQLPNAMTPRPSAASQSPR